MKQSIRFLLILSCSSYLCAATTCESWFKKSGVIVGPKCLEKCVVLMTGMDTFDCPQKCPNFCDQRSAIEKLLGGLAYYPGLTSKERDLIAKFPQKALQAYLAKEKAELATYKKFGRDTENDESDAYRHYLWAGLLSKELGPDLAREFLDAHESADMNSPEAAMDLANNRAGLLGAERLRKENRLDLANLEKDASEMLRDNRLVVLDPKGGIK